MPNVSPLHCAFQVKPDLLVKRISVHHERLVLIPKLIDYFCHIRVDSTGKELLHDAIDLSSKCTVQTFLLVLSDLQIGVTSPSCNEEFTIHFLLPRSP